MLLTMVGVGLGYLSCFWAFAYTRLSRRMFSFLDKGTPRIRRYDVIGTLEKVRRSRSRCLEVVWVLVGHGMGPVRQPRGKKPPSKKGENVS